MFTLMSTYIPPVIDKSDVNHNIYKKNIYISSRSTICSRIIISLDGISLKRLIIKNFKYC